jgi:hypothetical protein
MTFEERSQLQKHLAARWLVHTQNVLPVDASNILFDGKNQLAKDAMLVANFALCVLEDYKDCKSSV